MRGFCRWLHRYGYAAEDISARLPRSSRPPQRLPRYLSADQVASVLAAPALDTLAGFRDHVMMRLLYECGIRSGEIVALGIGDAMIEHRALHVAGRFIPFSLEMGLLLHDWLRLRQSTRPGKSNTLFVTSSGKPFRGARSVWEIVNRYARGALGLARGCERIGFTSRNRPWSGHYPHLFRAGFATALLNNGCDLRAVQQMLGHADLGTTARYLGVDIEMLKREHAKLRVPAPLASPAGSSPPQSQYPHPCAPPPYRRSRGPRDS